ncbi:MAG TPA: class I SAM-dependent methyltransferase [Candidatus Baltobacteraceae bacterium]|jgi:SAM-dependent methyltransferase|nr:class I SAM-dependent methyltransferase [Candidatus Baltobacteraceae bacterium]
MKISASAAKNRLHWDAQSDTYQAEHGAQLARNPLAWGVWSIPEDELHVLGDVRGKDVLEFGCGAAQWSIALSKLGARCTGLDNSERQLAHARANMQAQQTDFPLVHASAESVPLPPASFDIIFCDHGAMSFADPHHTVPEAARLLRDGGLLAFNAETPLHFICWDNATDAVTNALQTPYFENRLSEDENAVVYSLPYGEWIALFHRHGFVIEDLIELRAPEHADTTYGSYVTYDWARKWPAEQIWRVRKKA